MKFIPSIAFEEMSGSAKGVTAAKARGRKNIRNRGYGGGFKTAAQSGVKAVFKQLAQSWKGLSNAQILAWNALANTQKSKSVLGTSSRVSGANLYSRLNFWVVKSGNEALSAPPVLGGVDAPCEADLSLTADTFTFQLPDPPQEKADLRLVIMASAPQSRGVTKAYSKVVMIGSPRAIVDEQIDILADYKAAHGEVTSAAPKVFLKYFFINVKTGRSPARCSGRFCCRRIRLRSSIVNKLSPRRSGAIPCLLPHPTRRFISFSAWSGLHRLDFALYFYHQPGVLFRGLRLGPFSFSTMRLPPVVAPSASLPAALHSPCECRRRCTGALSPSS